jgi:hypothetical protein
MDVCLFYYTPHVIIGEPHQTLQNHQNHLD